MAKKKATQRRPRRALHRSSKGTHTAVMADMNRVLAKHGITGMVAELRVTKAADDCPPGTHKEVVCRKQDDGTTVCREECV